MARAGWKKFRRLFWLSALGIVVVAVVAVTFYVMYLDRIVTKQFEGRRWTLPAQVYAAPLELYASLPLNGSDLEHELQRLQYRRVDKLEHPGTYRLQGTRLDIALRPARFADETRPASILTVVSGEKGIDSLRDSDGKDVPIARLEPLLIGSIFPIHGEDRIVVTPQEVPALLPQALTTVEDRKFYTHHGVDPVGIARAMWVNVRAGQMEQGGSTLTQQLVKSYFLDSRRTLGRKVREAIMAMSLDANFSKADLMNAYINEIFLGQDGDRAVHGFGLASQFYFGKPLSELDLSEVALLVAIVRGPTYYDPRRHPDRARSRRDLVLKLMGERGIVKADDALAAEKKPLGVTSRATGGYYPAYLDFVRRTLRRDYHDQDLTEAGLRIYTSLEPRAQDQAELALERELARLDHQKKYPDAKLEGAAMSRPPHLRASRRDTSSGDPVAPVAIKLANGTVWRPENFTKQTYGPVPLVRALAESLNQATVGVGMDVGLSKVTETLVRFGIERPPAQVPSMLLGAIDITPMEVAQLYNGLANGGFRSSLRAVRAVISADSKPLKAFPLEVTPVASPDVVYEVDRMMEQVMEKGTGRGARAVLPPNLVVAGKSGTSSDYHDNWFAGFSGSHLAVVWVGYDDNLPTGFTGSSGALPIWARMMAGLGTTSWDAPMPESLAEAWIDYGSGLRVDKDCPDKDAVPIAVPVGIELPINPVCPGSKVPSIIERAGEWIRDLMH